MELVAGAVLILLSGFFSGSETAVYRGQWVRLVTWANKRTRGARLAARLLDRRESTVIATLVGTNLCNVFAAMLFSRFVASRFGPAYTGIAVIVVVSLTLVFGEFLPKAFAAARPNGWLRSSSGLLAASMVLFAPAILLLAGIARVFATPFVRTRAKLSLTRQDFLAVLRQRERTTRDTGSMEHHTSSVKREEDTRNGQPISSMVARLFELSGARVAEAQIPLEQVVAVPQDADLKDILTIVEEHGFSRILVYRGSKANIIGVILAKDLLAAPAYRIRRIDRVKADTRAMEVLEAMRRRGVHIAVVVDESGAVTGMVTLEDILEELVGEIRSED